MKKTLYDLWYSYISQASDQVNDEQSTLLDDVVRYGEALRGELSAAQEETFLHYEDAVIALNAVIEREAFYKGIHFTASFLLEALYCI